MDNNNCAHEIKNQKYLSDHVLSHKEKLSHVKEAFTAAFGYDAENIFLSPGRSEVIGNHTDHQHGCCMVCTVECVMWAAVSKRKDCTAIIESEGFGRIELDLNRLEPVRSEQGSSIALIRGIAHGFSATGAETGGFDAYVSSDIKAGSGLSSSAAFEILIASIFNELYNSKDFSPAETAMIAHRAENEYFGKPCGLMDMLACSVGGLTYMDFYDNASPSYTGINTDFERYGYSLVLTNTHSSHEGLTEEYAAIRSEMEQVAAYYGKTSLAYVDEYRFYGELKSIRRVCSDRALLRAMHFFDENARVKAAAAALKQNDFTEFLRLVNESGDSSYMYLQNIYPSFDINNRQLALALCMSKRLLADEGACRIHGGGFGGTVFALVPAAKKNEYIRAMEDIFGEGSAVSPRIAHFGSGMAL